MNPFRRLIPSLSRSPFLWGMLACLGFYTLVNVTAADSEFVRRYFAAHPVEYVETAMFFVGIAALLLKAAETFRQGLGLGEPLLGPRPAGGQPVEDCAALFARVERVAGGHTEDYRARRLRKTLLYVQRTGSAAGLDDELKYLAEEDAERAYAGYGLVRMIIWAIPILGFLGTVIGIALAMGKLTPQALEDSLPAVMAGLTVAFDTTALALALSIVLFFSQFLADREERRLLERVDEQVAAELLGRFERVANTPDGQLAAVRKMLRALVDSNEEIVRRQAVIWTRAVEGTDARWGKVLEASARQLESALSTALNENLKTHAREMVAAERQAVDQNRRQWERLQQAVAGSMEAMTGVQAGMVRQAEVLHRVVDATGQIANLETELNRNLASLAGAKNFEETVMSLAAAIHLLSARLGPLPDEDARVTLDDPARRKGQAA